MANKAFTKIYTSDEDLNSVQESVETTLDPFIKNDLLDGTFLNGVSLESGKDNIINHKLNRQIKGWIITSIDSSATVYDKQSTNNLKDLTLILRTSADCTVNLYVF